MKCSVCGLEPPASGLMVIASDDGVVVSADGGSFGLADRDEHEGHRVLAGDVVCMNHIAIRPDGRYVRVEDGG